jgi:hypothetical protein
MLLPATTVVPWLVIGYGRLLDRARRSTQAQVHTLAGLGFASPRRLKRRIQSRMSSYSHARPDAGTILTPS